MKNFFLTEKVLLFRKQFPDAASGFASVSKQPLSLVSPHRKRATAWCVPFSFLLATRAVHSASPVRWPRQRLRLHFRCRVDDKVSPSHTYRGDWRIQTESLTSCLGGLTRD